MVTIHSFVNIARQPHVRLIEHIVYPRKYPSTSAGLPKTPALLYYFAARAIEATLSSVILGK